MKYTRHVVTGRRVPGIGPQPARVFGLGEMPGPTEDRTGVPFSGAAGKELTRFLNGYTVPLTRADLYLTNLRKHCPLDTRRVFVCTPDDEAQVHAELHACQPELIVTFGLHAARWLLGDDVTLEAYHGIPHRATRQVPGTLVLPVYNPAAILHSPALQAFFAQDMQRLGLLLRGQLAPAPVDDCGEYYARVSTFDTGVGTYAVDTEGSAARPWGLSWSRTPGYGSVLDAAVVNGLGAQWGRLAADGGLSLIFHHSLHDLPVLRAMGIDVEALGIPFDDTMVESYLLGLEPQGLKPLMYRHAGMRQDDYSDVVAEPSARIAEDWLGQVLATCDGADEIVKAGTLIARMLAKDEPATLRQRWATGRAREILVDETGHLSPYDADPREATLDDIPEVVAVRYSGRDPDGTLRVHRSLRPQITAMGLDDVYAVDLAIVPMVDRMQTVGLGADVEHFRALSVVYAVELADLDAQIADMAGRPINASSGDQVATLLYDELKLHEQVPNLRLKKTKSQARYSTNDKTLQALEGVHPIVKLITDRREVQKLKGTYADPMPALIARDGRLHPQYRLTRTETGRLSASDPNVLAFPKWSVRGKAIRQGFIAGPGHELMSVDLNQIEVRVLAHDSGDDTMCGQLWSGYDFHRMGAAQRRKKAPDAVTEDERFRQKCQTFGTVMGITEFGLCDQLHKAGLLDATPETCRADLDGWFAQYPGCAQYIAAKHAEARRHGFVRDMWGRLRWLEGVHSTDDYIAAEACRQAQATPIQSGAQGVIKRVMRALWPQLKALRADGVWVECLLQIHDDLVFEYDAEARELVQGIVMDAMTETVTLNVPVTAKAAHGATWGDL